MSQATNGFQSTPLSASSPKLKISSLPPSCWQLLSQYTFTQVRASHVDSRFRIRLLFVSWNRGEIGVSINFMFSSHLTFIKKKFCFCRVLYILIRSETKHLDVWFKGKWSLIRLCLPEHINQCIGARALAAGILGDRWPQISNTG